MLVNPRIAAARGYLLIGVFFIHGVYSVLFAAANPSDDPISLALIKTLAPSISVFFFLAGMSSRKLGIKSARAVLQNSLMLLFLAWFCNSVGLIIETLIYDADGNGLVLLEAALKPIILGTGGPTYITWFFVVLAVVRPLAWLFERHKLAFLAAWVVIIGLIIVAKRLHLPDNLYEWRNWPCATLFMIIGMKFPQHWHISGLVAFAALAGGLLLTWFNVPGMFHTMPCLTCHLDFTAEPMVGAYGTLPIFLLQELLIFLFILWVSAATVQTTPGRIANYFGRSSLQFLVLHGWLIVSIEPFVASYLPPHETILFLLAALVLIPAAHAIVFTCSKTALNKALSLCFHWARSVFDFNAIAAGRRCSSKFRRYTWT